MEPTATPRWRFVAVEDHSNGKRTALSEARKITRQACQILTEFGVAAGVRSRQAPQRPVCETVRAP